MQIGKFRQTGFSYIGLLALITIAGIGMAGTSLIWSHNAQREKEKELLFVGEAYRVAIGHYYENSPINGKQFPTKLEELLLDKRYSSTKRYLRKLYKDPMMIGNQWGLIIQQERIVGVYSQSKMLPIKRTGFLPQHESFSGAEKYQDWQFIYTPGSISVQLNINSETR